MKFMPIWQAGRHLSRRCQWDGGHQAASLKGGVSNGWFMLMEHRFNGKAKPGRAIP